MGRAMKLNRRKLVASLLAGVFVLAGVYCGLVWMGLHGPTIERDASKLRVGMSMEEVTATWGRPAIVSTSPSTDVRQAAVWHTWDGMVEIISEGGRVTDFTAFK